MCKDSEVKRMRQTSSIGIAIAVGNQAYLVTALKVSQADRHVRIRLGAGEPCVHIESIQVFGDCLTRSIHVFKGSEKSCIPYFFVPDHSVESQEVV